MSGGWRETAVVVERTEKMRRHTCEGISTETLRARNVSTPKYKKMNNPRRARLVEDKYEQSGQGLVFWEALAC